jgi:hypothetical protein
VNCVDTICDGQCGQWRLDKTAVSGGLLKLSEGQQFSSWPLLIVEWLWNYLNCGHSLVRQTGRSNTVISWWNVKREPTVLTECSLFSSRHSTARQNILNYGVASIPRTTSEVLTTVKFSPEEGDIMFLRNVWTNLEVYLALKRRGATSTNIYCIKSVFSFLVFISYHSFKIFELCSVLAFTLISRSIDCFKESVQVLGPV